jgi:hypothetical protein
MSAKEEEPKTDTTVDEPQIKEHEDEARKKAKADFEKVVGQYLENNPILRSNKKVAEFEIRFGSNPKLAKSISKIDYDNVVNQLYACGFKTDNIDGIQILRVYSDYLHPQTGERTMSNIRAEIVGTDMIQHYCKTNSIQKLIDIPSTVFNKLKFTRKTNAQSASGEKIRPVDIADYNFRASYQNEEEFQTNHPLARNIIAEWGNSKKIFRCMNRVRFRHPNMPVFVDLSIVKGSKTSFNKPIPEYTIQEAGVFNNPEKYEIELEIDNTRVGTGTDYNESQPLLVVLRKCIRITLSGIQMTKYPISYHEQKVVIGDYMKLLHGEEYQPRKILSKDFIGPSSFTLQMENINEPVETSTIPNIRKNYTVTDKADGERRLLYINHQGKIYLIDTNMNVIFTGTVTKEKRVWNSILDGEHIKYDKTGKFINLYAAFDLYFINKLNIREYGFIAEDMGDQENKYRLPLLNAIIDNIKPISIMDKQETVHAQQTKTANFVIKCKEFYLTTNTESIFQCCSKILSRYRDGLFEYNTDGLIFTPSNTGVGSREIGKASALEKFTWEGSLKWKPPEFNTIDFLVVNKLDSKGKPEVHHIFQEGKNMQGVQDVIQYKTIELHCGFDIRNKQHAFINPFQDTIDDIIPQPTTVYSDNYKHVPFCPTNPYHPGARYCNVLLKQEANNVFMVTEEGQYFEENMIVEFRYELTNKDGWNWVPLRVRYDKTSELNSGVKNYGNAYHVANSNWHSIHHPITEEMITTGEKIPQEIVTEDVYYNRSNEQTSTQGLRDFHNLYVKRKLIIGVSNPKDILIDYAVGKAGDLSKWTSAGLAFVFGIDVFKDNIHNRLDGACARYLRAKRKNIDTPDSLYVTGNSSLNIRSGNAFSTEKDREITNAIFGVGPKEERTLGRGVYRHYGIAQTGFHVSSVQFAFHYFFENKRTIHEFLRNISECTRINGYFIGTCYDGKTVFNMLKSKQKGEGIVIMSEGRKIFEIIKMYDQTGFPDDDMSVGYPINVYQESINQYLQEYLVNFDYVVRIMEDYGFVPVFKSECVKMGLPDSTGMFSELFANMENELKRNSASPEEYGKAIFITEEEKRISFMNRYFVFKKIRNVNTDKIAKIIDEQNKMADDIEQVITEDIEAIEKKESAPAIVKPIVRKIKKPKIVLEKYATETTNIEGPATIVTTETETVATLQQVPKKITIKKPAIKILP